MTNADPGREVLADLLQLASEAGPDRLVTTDRLLREIVGPDAVNEAHRTWTDRLWEWFEGGDRQSPATPDHDVISPGADGDTMTLLRSIRATAPAPGAGAER